MYDCIRLDLAIWLSDFSQLKNLKNEMARGLALTQDTDDGGVAHHLVEVYLFEAASGEYRGKLCGFGKCPEKGKRECDVPGCGKQPFLRQIQGYRFDPAWFAIVPKVVLFDRAGNFLVRLPKIDTN
ncbi:MAG TPA: hypothetical protein VKU01_25450 [Bryobacteraceae bacterium]|nr:hypothetical protein [Bryobacteraceae bacterium]